MKRTLAFLTALLIGSIGVEFWRSGVAWSSVGTAIVQTLVVSAVAGIAFAVIDRERINDDERNP